MPPLICTAQQGPGKSPDPSEWFALTQHYTRARRLPYELYYYICGARMQVISRDFDQSCHSERSAAPCHVILSGAKILRWQH